MVLAHIPPEATRTLWHAKWRVSLALNVSNDQRSHFCMAWVAFPAKKSDFLLLSFLDRPRPWRSHGAIWRSIYGGIFARPGPMELQTSTQRGTTDRVGRTVAVTKEPPLTVCERREIDSSQGYMYLPTVTTTRDHQRGTIGSSGVTPSP